MTRCLTLLVVLAACAGELAAQAPKKKPADLAPWIKQVATLKPEEQLKAVAEKLKELNGGFDGKFSHEIRDGKVVSIVLPASYVSDISRLVIFPDLEGLSIRGENGNQSRLEDISVLAVMKKLRGLNIEYTAVKSIAVLKDKPIVALLCQGSKVDSLAPIAGKPLTELTCSLVKDLQGLLKGMKLTRLVATNSDLRDLTPLKDMPLTVLDVSYCGVTSLKPLRGFKLKYLAARNVGRGLSLEPLADMPLQTLDFSYTPNVQGFDTLKTLLKLRQLDCSGSGLTSLDVLKGLALESLGVNENPIAIPKGKPGPLDALRGMPLKGLGIQQLGLGLQHVQVLKELDLENLQWDFDPKEKKSVELLRSLPNLKRLNGKPVAEALK